MRKELILVRIIRLFWVNANTDYFEITKYETTTVFFRERGTPNIFTRMLSKLNTSGVPLSFDENWN